MQDSYNNICILVFLYAYCDKIMGIKQINLPLVMLFFLIKRNNDVFT